MSHEPKFGLSLPTVLAGALAAASAAVASSWLGVAGTVIGAAIMSVVASVASVVYARPLTHGSERIKAVIPAKMAPSTRAGLPGIAASEAQTTTMEAEAAGTGDTLVIAAPEQPTDPPADVPGGRGGQRVHWRTVAVSAVAMLIVALAMLTAAEVLTGRTGLTGSDGEQPTIVRFVEGSSDTDNQPDTTVGDPSDAEADPNTIGGDEGAQPTDPTGGGTTTEPTPTEPTPTEPTPTEPTPTEPTPTEPTPTEPTESQPTESPSTDPSLEDPNSSVENSGTSRSGA